MLQEATRGVIGWFFDTKDATVLINGKYISLNGGSNLNIGLSDTGTSGILLPTDVVGQINAMIGASPDNGIPCDVASSGPDVVFNIQGSKFYIPSFAYVYKHPGNKGCQSQFLPGAENIGTAIFGATFLQCFYGIFDKNNKRVGFAQLNGTVVGKLSQRNQNYAVQSSHSILILSVIISLLVLQF